MSDQETTTPSNDMRLPVPEDAPIDTSGDFGVIWQAMIPTDDLNLKEPPERWLRLGSDVPFVLATLAGKGPTTPKLLRTDANGRLLSIAQPSPVDTSSTQAVRNASAIFPATPAEYADGYVFVHEDQAGFMVHYNTVSDTTHPGQISSPDPMGGQIEVGDAITVAPVVSTIRAVRINDSLNLLAQGLAANVFTNIDSGPISVFKRVVKFTLGYFQGANGILQIQFVGVTSSKVFSMGSLVSTASYNDRIDHDFPDGVDLSQVFDIDSQFRIQVNPNTANGVVSGVVFWGS